MKVTLEFTVLVLVVLVAILLALGLMTKPPVASGLQITPVVGEPVCEGPACLLPEAYLTSILN